ncbi:MAG TPA: hypothetical protein DF712_02800, partial [Balneola sp.]|nr:hypothetical protein [Balneola sp.]
MRKFTITLLLLCLNFGVQAQQNLPEEKEELRTNNSKKNNIDYRFGYAQNPTMEAVRISGQSIKLDGVLDEGIWATAPVATGFTQRSPKDGGKPSQRTEARILYTDNEVYVGIMAYDNAPD